MFKIGDKVRLLEDYASMPAGTEGVVTALKKASITQWEGRPVTHLIGFMSDTGKALACFNCRLELVSRGFNISKATDQELADEYRLLREEASNCAKELHSRGFEVSGPVGNKYTIRKKLVVEL